jgi:hypothetical protein
MLIREFLFPFRPESTRACYNMCTQEYTVSNLLYKAHSQVRVRLAPLALTLARSSQTILSPMSSHLYTPSVVMLCCSSLRGDGEIMKS